MSASKRIELKSVDSLLEGWGKAGRNAQASFVVHRSDSPSINDSSDDAVSCLSISVYSLLACEFLRFTFCFWKPIVASDSILGLHRKHILADL